MSEYYSYLLGQGRFLELILTVYELEEINWMPDISIAMYITIFEIMPKAVTFGWFLYLANYYFALLLVNT